MHDITLIATTSGVTVTSTEREVTFVQVGVQGPAGPSAHGDLSGLADDDHLQYHTDARGDARYAPLAHASDTGNPHATTAAQTGADAAGTAAAAVLAHAAGTGVHAIAATYGLQVALDGKASASHDHTGIYDPAGAAAAAQAASAPSAKGVTNGDSHDHSGGDGAQIDYSTLSNKPTLGTAAATDTTAYEATGSVSTHAALTTTHGISTYGATLVDDADAATARSTLGLGGAAALNVGTTTGTVAAGDDSRLSDARTPVGHTHATGDVTGFSAAALAAAPAETTSTVGTLISGATEKTTPVDADSLGLSDSAASGVLKKLTWANFKSALNGIFARLSGISGGQTLIGGTNAADSLTLQGTSASGTTGTDKATRILVGNAGATEALTILQNGAVGIGQTTPLYPVDIGAATRRVQIDAAGNVGCGFTPGLIPTGSGASNAVCSHNVVNLDDVSISGTSICAGVRLIANPPSTSTASNRAAYFYVQSKADCAQNIGSLRAFMCESRHYGSGSASTIYGQYATASHYGAGLAATLASSFASTANSAGGSVTNAYGAIIYSTNDSTGAIATNYGSYVLAGNYSATGAITTNIGSYVSAAKNTAGNVVTNVGSTIVCKNSNAGGSITTNVGLEIGGANSAWSNSGTITNNTVLLIGNSTNIGTTKKAIDCQSTADSAFAGKLGIGNSAPTAKLDIMATTTQLRLGYDAIYGADLTVSSNGTLKIAAPLSWMPAASATPAANGEIALEFTSDTQVTIKGKGSDGVVRLVSLTLA